MIRLKTPEEIEKIREGGKILAKILERVAFTATKPGCTTADLNDLAEELMAKFNVRPAFKGYAPFDEENCYPAAICTSVNHEVVHTIPRGDKKLRKGDIIGIDVGIEHLGMYTDMAVTVGVGKISKDAQKLIDVTRESMMAGIAQAAPGNRIGDISNAIQVVVEAAGFSVVRDLVGHGTGFELHEDPKVPNFGKPGTGIPLEVGMVLAIEPMVNVGHHAVIFRDDGWTVETADKSLSAHFELTVAITREGPKILTVLP